MSFFRRSSRVAGLCRCGRCRRRQVAQALQERWKTAPARAELLARLSGGRLGWAVNQAQAEDWGAEREACFREWSQILQGNRVRGLRWLKKRARTARNCGPRSRCGNPSPHDLLLRTLSGGAELTNIDFQESSGPAGGPHFTRS